MITTRAIIPYPEDMLHLPKPQDELQPFEFGHVGWPFMAGHYQWPFIPRNADEMYRTGPLSIPKPFVVADFSEKDDCYEIHADLPGVNKEDLDIQLHSESNVITIRATRRFEEPAECLKIHNILLDERHLWGHEFAERSIVMPTDCNIHETKGEFTEGVLRLSIPKSSEPWKKHDIAGFLPSPHPMKLWK